MNHLFSVLSLALALTFVACNKEEAPQRVDLTSVTLSSSALALVVGATHTLAASVLPANASDRTIVWSSDDVAVATIDPSTGVVTGRALGQTTLRALPVADQSLAVHCTVTVVATAPYAVGSLYPDATAPQGIVFWVDPLRPLSGKIVSLDQTRKAWGNSEVAALTLSADDGRTNLALIQQLPHWATEYPAFAWCAAKGEGWYLPALNELLALYDEKERLDEVITLNGDAPFAAADYWTSTERRLNGASTAVTVTLRPASDNESWASKDGENYVRAIKKY